ncbi:hypothetical protein [Saccharothrix yanglingensis]|uniref:hypothetical protein n=1 Tax=Saccharothrix yanglingensis TaxID=659496 RepID=UPI0027D346CF|nr:hypothetical protein [Saccharothrix yanglingensis]
MARENLSHGTDENRRSGDLAHPGFAHQCECPAVPARLGTAGQFQAGAEDPGEPGGLPVRPVARLGVVPQQPLVGAVVLAVGGSPPRRAVGSSTTSRSAENTTSRLSPR